MTTICTDGVTIAADGRMTEGDMVCASRTKKLHKMSDGSVIGAAGQVTAIYKALKAIQEGKSYSGKFNLLRLFPNGRAYAYEGCTSGIPVEIPAACGSGRSYALVAMDCGLSPKEAIKAAAKRDIYTGGRVTECKPENLND